jgi:hypothetical protein
VRENRLLRTEKEISSQTGAPYMYRMHRSFSVEKGKIVIENRFAQNRKKIQAKPAHPRVRRSFSFLFETRKM